MNRKENKGFGLGIFTGAMVMAAVCLIVFSMVISFQNREELTSSTALNGTKVSDNQSAILTKVGVLANYIDQYSLNEVDDETLINGIYKGVLNSLGDPYSVYYTKSEYEQVEESSSGQYYGIGVVIQQADDTEKTTTIVKVFEDAPAAKAGLKVGDILTKVEGKSVKGMDSTKIVGLIKGKSDTKVKVEVKRDDKTLQFEVERAKVEAQTVEYKMLDGKIGYISISEFDEPTASQFKKAIKKLKSQGAKGFVFDLRDNPGGLYDTVCDMLDYILPKGLLVYTEDKYGNKEESKSDASCLDLPFSVIVNGNSASASEIFAGAVKDYKAGKIVGTTTFGKGIVQRLFPLSDGSAIKLTVAKYYTPNGKNIHKIGIKPDVQVELSKKAKKYGDKNDNQLQKAIEQLNLK